MGTISPERLKLVKGLVKTLPLSALRTLDTALGLSKDEKLRDVRDLILLELETRHTRDAVFEPYLALFQPRTDGLDGEVFPSWLLNNLWRELENAEPQLSKEARFAVRGLRDGDPTPVVFFRLVTAAATILRDTPLSVAPKTHDPSDLREISEFAHYLDLHRILRQFLVRLPDWMGRIDADKAATLRLWYKDACAFSEDAGVRFIEAIFANLEDGAIIIKFIATVADRPNDRFLAESELADFGERILVLAEEKTHNLKTLLTGKSKDLSFMATAGTDIARCLNALSGLEHYIELSREGPWGKRVGDAHKVIAGLVEDRLKSASRTVLDALPMKPQKISGRIRKDYPHVAANRDEMATRNAMAILQFVRDIKYTASNGGYATLHAKTLLELEQHLDIYLEDLTQMANGEGVVEPDKLMAVVEVVTDFVEALSGEEKACLARRRVASSSLFNPSKSVA